MIVSTQIVNDSPGLFIPDSLLGRKLQAFVYGGREIIIKIPRENNDEKPGLNFSTFNMEIYDQSLLTKELVYIYGLDLELIITLNP